MLITKIVKTKLVPFTKKHYESLGYVFERNKLIEIPIEHLPPNSAVKVEVECAGECKNRFFIQYGQYITTIKNNRIIQDYCCKKCFQKIRTQYFIENYGVNSPMKLLKYQEKKKKTMNKKYGVDYSLQNKEIAKKASSNSKKTLIKKYGVDNPFLVPGAQDKRNNTMLSIYGTINSQEIPNTRLKTQNTLLERYGVNNVRNIPGVEDKIRKTKEILGIQRPKHLITELELFRNECVSLKNKQRKKLFDSWDGFDFYDGEYIRDYLNLNHNNPKYPTIDHKISILYGFLNGLSVGEISKYDNLCITKRTLNSRKNKSSEKEFLKKIKNKL